MSSSRTARATGAGFLVGGALGFGLGLLLAPGEGRELRRRIAYLLDRWAADLSGVVDRLDVDADESSYARARADALVADARQQAQVLLSEADALLTSARQNRPQA